MTARLVFAFVFASTLSTVLLACSPPLKAFQAAHPEKPCLQCSEINVMDGCSHDLHNRTFKCNKPAIAYSLSPSGTCAQAQISCMRDASKFPPVDQTVMIVGMLSMELTNNTGVYSPITPPSPNNVLLSLICNSESQWMMKSMDENELAQPLTVQCAHNIPNFKLPNLMESGVVGETPKTEESTAKTNETPKKKKKKTKKSKKQSTTASTSTTSTTSTAAPTTTEVASATTEAEVQTKSTSKS